MKEGKHVYLSKLTNMSGVLKSSELRLGREIKEPDEETIFSDKLDQAAGIYYFNPLSNEDSMSSFDKRIGSRSVSGYMRSAPGSGRRNAVLP